MSILKLLLIGGAVEFPSGYKLQGDPKNMYIQLYDGLGEPDGVWELSKDGLKSALRDALNYEKKNS